MDDVLRDVAIATGRDGLMACEIALDPRGGAPTVSLVTSSGRTGVGDDLAGRIVTAAVRRLTARRRCPPRGRTLIVPVHPRDRGEGHGDAGAAMARLVATISRYELGQDLLRDALEEWGPAARREATALRSVARNRKVSPAWALRRRTDLPAPRTPTLGELLWWATVDGVAEHDDLDEATTRGVGSLPIEEGTLAGDVRRRLAACGAAGLVPVVDAARASMFAPVGEGLDPGAPPRPWRWPGLSPRAALAVARAHASLSPRERWAVMATAGVRRAPMTLRTAAYLVPIVERGRDSDDVLTAERVRQIVREARARVASRSGSGWDLLRAETRAHLRAVLADESGLVTVARASARPCGIHPMVAAYGLDTGRRATTVAAWLDDHARRTRSGWVVDDE